MKENRLPLALAVLRVSRGWSREELEIRSGLRRSSVSDDKGGKEAPREATLRRWLAAMGFAPSALEDARALVAILGAEGANRVVARLARPRLPAAPAAPREEDRPAARPAENRPHREIEPASVEAEKVAARLARLFFALIEPRLAASGEGGGGPDGAGEPGSGAP